MLLIGSICESLLHVASASVLASFIRATNAVLNVLKGAKEDVLMKLLYSNRVPILTYACDVKEYAVSDMSDCSVAMNYALRKIFDFKEVFLERFLM